MGENAKSLIAGRLNPLRNSPALWLIMYSHHSLKINHVSKGLKEYIQVSHKPQEYGK